MEHARKFWLGAIIYVEALNPFLGIKGMLVIATDRFLSTNIKCTYKLSFQ